MDDKSVWSSDFLTKCGDNIKYTHVNQIRTFYGQLVVQINGGLRNF